MYGGVVEICVLGPVEIWHEGQCLTVTRKQPRLILGALALESGNIVTQERLIDILWGDRPPRQARAVVQSRVSELRAAIGELTRGAAETNIGSRGGGYVLDIPRSHVDAHRFSDCLAIARQSETDETRRDHLRAAISLWRGDMMGGGLPGPDHDRLCLGLESTRLTAVEDLYEAELRLGEHFKVADELLAIVAATPVRERLVRLALVALHRTGRTAEALQEYERWRRWLSDELGVDPGEELKTVYLRLLRSGTRVDAAARDSSRAML